jgi:rhodanese-related sulfurtransferase/glyoxylase-like metal-dependent hydrolase (beta-lactamase superfamily II)
LSKATGAPIVFGPTAEPAFDAVVAKDEQIFKLGDVAIKVLHTPGHTMESTCFLLIDEDGKENALFTGDTLFIGDVGRPDLAIKTNLTKEDLAAHLYESIHNKILTLPNEVIIYPGHGAGSACGKNLSSDRWDTLGHQRETNYALKAKDKATFIGEVTTGLLPPPFYFPKNAMLNKGGYESFEKVLTHGMNGLTPDELEALAEAEGALILDTRAPKVFKDGFIPKSINIGIDGDFAPWVGNLILDIQQPIIVVTEPGREEEVITRLSRVGYDHCIGYLKGGFATWNESGREVDTVANINAAELAARSKNHDLFIVDVRKPSEYDAEHLLGAVNVPLNFINDHMDDVPTNKPVYIHCAGGYRSMIASSILKARGYQNLINVEGGFTAIKETDMAKSEYVCPNS